MEDNLVEGLVEDHQEVAHEGTGVADAGEDPLSSRARVRLNLQPIFRKLGRF